jgi:hypothetical protein
VICTDSACPEGSAGAVQQRAQPVGGQLAALVVVGGDEADNLRGCQRRVDNHHRDAGATCFDHRANQSAIVEWGEHDAIDALAEKAFDDLHLLLAIVFASAPSTRRSPPGPPTTARVMP